MNGAVIGKRGTRINCSSSADSSHASFLGNKKDEKAVSLCPNKLIILERKYTPAVSQNLSLSTIIIGLSQYFTPTPLK